MRENLENVGTTKGRMVESQKKSGKYKREVYFVMMGIV
jgi:hypothetical protein